MKLIEKILVPVDVNRDYQEQLNTAITLAREFNSEISVIYVLPDKELHPEINQLLTKYINKILSKITKKLEGKEVSYSEPKIDNGNVVNRILHAANEQNANLILLGAGNKTKDKKFKLGTTAEKLIQLSDIPIWVARSDQKTEINKILCPVDFSDPSKRALRNAILLSNNFESSLIILGVVEPFLTTSLRIEIDQEVENKKLKQQFKQQMNEFLSEFELKTVNHTVDIRLGIPDKEILKGIQKNNADLLIMGTNGRSGLSQLMMGSVTEKVIRELPCSFITTKTQNIFELKLDNEIKEIEIHYNNAEKLQKSGLYKEAIEQCLICLQINDMHVPSMYKLAKLYSILGDNEKMNYYEKLATDLLRRLWDKKIEYEIRRHYKPNVK